MQPLTAKAESYSEEAAYGDYLSYKQVDMDEDGTYDYVEISDCDESATEIEIPLEIDGLPVMSIGDGAFNYCNSLTSIEIPNGVISIGEHAFYYCGSLTSIEVPGSVTSIGKNAFFGCSSLTSITIVNPECEINYTYTNSTICNGRYDGRMSCYFYGTIYGYENSTAQSYAEKYDYTFESLGSAPVITTPAVTTTVTTTQTTVETKVSATETSDTTVTEITGVTTTTAVTTTPAVTEVKGNANNDGKLDVRDASFIARLLAQGKGDQIPMNADFNGDGKVNIRDAAAIARYLANKFK